MERGCAVLGKNIVPSHSLTDSNCVFRVTYVAAVDPQQEFYSAEFRILSCFGDAHHCLLDWNGGPFERRALPERL